MVASQTSLNIEEHRLALALQMDVECVDGGAVAHLDRGAIRVLRRSGCSMMFSTGSSAFAASSSPKYMRVARPMLMPRAAIQKLMCGAIALRPLRPTTLPGLMVRMV